MFDRIDAGNFDDLMLPMSRRSRRGVYFVRVCGWSPAVKDGVSAYCQAATRRGVIIDGQLGNPDRRQLDYMNDVLGADFQPDEAFLTSKLSLWIPNLGEQLRREFARALSGLFDLQRRQGKTDSSLKSLYSKAMTWLYFRFMRLTPMLGEDDPPRVLYATQGITAHELMMLRIVNVMGADIMLVEPAGDAPYLKHDPNSACSQLLVGEGQPFPEDFSLKQLSRELEQRPAVSRTAREEQGRSQQKPGPRQVPLAPVDPLSRFRAPEKAPCTNAWMQAADYDQILTPIASRGVDPALFYNAFIRLRGVRDRTTYVSDLHQFYQRLRSTGRKVLIVDGGLSRPTSQEIGGISRRNAYSDTGAMIADLAGNLPACASVQLQRMMQRAFATTMLDYSKAKPKLQHQMNAAVYLLCWIRRYQGDIFGGYRDGDMPCYIQMGGCRDGEEALYPRFLSRLPADVLLAVPDLNRPCALTDGNLLELSGEESLSLDRFPRDAGALKLKTVAAHAEDELADVLYRDSGLYQIQQFARGEALTLDTTYDELYILWKQDLKYRKGFDTAGDIVTMPVLYAKVSGVEDGNALAYWQKVRLLLEAEGCVQRRLPMLKPGAPNPSQALALKGLRDGKLQRGPLQSDTHYPFGILRREMQAHILDKVQLMLDRRLIRGTFVNGTEYTVLATVLNLDHELLRLLQSFDFTRANPKLVCFSVDDRGASLEDAILITFLNLVGLDIALFVPTGYQTVEQHLTGNLPVEHRIGPFLYDMSVPDFNRLPRPRKPGVLKTLFKRGN